MYCSNLARAPGIPLLSRVPILCKGNKLNPSSLLLQFHSKTLTNDPGAKTKILQNSIPKLKLNNLLIGVRVFSTDSLHRPIDHGETNKPKKALPWIAGYKNREGKSGEKRAPAVNTNHRSSWVDSAERLLSKNDTTNLSNESNENKNVGRNREREKRRDLYEEEEEGERIDDPRWDGIRSKVDNNNRFERQVVRHWDKQENWGRKVWKEAKETSSVPKMVGQGIYGVGPVLAALTVQRREFYALYVQEGLDLSGNNRKKKDKRGVEKVLKLAEKLGLKVIETAKHDLNMVVDSRPHQGLVLDASPLEMVNVRELEHVNIEGKGAPVWVALDEVTDPQNLGAIIRSAYYFGVAGVVLCAKNSAPLSGVVSKASAGSLELIELRSCKNMMQFLSSSIENGWRVLGGSVSNKARPLSEVADGVPTILVLGSEGSGLRALVERTCSELVRIPGSNSMDECAGENALEAEEMDNQSGTGQELNSFLAVESLNVSVAAGVLLYHLVGNNTRLVTEKANTCML